MNMRVVRRSPSYGTDSKQRVLALFVPDLNMGGAEKTVVTLANELVGQGVTVHLLLMNSEGCLIDQVSDNVSIIELFKGSSRNKMVLLFKSIAGLIKYINLTQPAVILSSVFGANISSVLASLFAGRGDRTKVVIREASSLKNYSLIERLLIKALYPKSHKLVAVSESGALQLEQFTGAEKEKIEVIHNAVSSSKIRALAKRGDSAEYSDIRPYIVSVGRLVEAKAFDTLIDAFVMCAKHNAQVKLIIVGDGPLKAVLQHKITTLGIQHRVFLVGEKPNPFTYINSAELFVLSSRWEGFPNTLLEAMCLNVPIVATDCEFGPKEILGEARGSMLVPVDDPACLAAAINSVLGAGSVRIDYSDALSNFSHQRIIKRYSDLLL